MLKASQVPVAPHPHETGPPKVPKVQIENMRRTPKLLYTV